MVSPVPPLDRGGCQRGMESGVKQGKFDGESHRCGGKTDKQKRAIQEAREPSRKRRLFRCGELFSDHSILPPCPPLTERLRVTMTITLQAGKHSRPIFETAEISAERLYKKASGRPPRPTKTLILGEPEGKESEERAR